MATSWEYGVDEMKGWGTNVFRSLGEFEDGGERSISSKGEEGLDACILYRVV